MEWKREQFRITDDPEEINNDVVSRLLANTYWGHKRPRLIVDKLIQNSLCFALVSGQEQIGFARVATDYTVLSWLSDLVISDAYRNHGLGEWLLECVLNHPAIAQTQFVLQTENAYPLYEKFGFKVSNKIMTRELPTL